LLVVLIVVVNVPNQQYLEYEDENEDAQREE
jgi:hypothetical protein